MARMARKDISDKLIHFTKGESWENAFETLRKIIREYRIIGGNNNIKGGYECVCFTEAPLDALEGGLRNPDDFSRYDPFGIMFEKNWIFDKGGRPVIYQTCSEFDLLPDSHRWRHMRYEPTADSPVDFTWEREWRLLTDELSFDQSNAAIVVPSQEWADRTIKELGREEDYKIMQYGLILDEQLAELYREPFWKVCSLPKNIQQHCK